MLIEGDIPSHVAEKNRQFEIASAGVSHCSR
jgi:hypothetical protein